MRFKDRHDAGGQLAKALAPLVTKETVVYALPRGGVVLGYELSKALKAPLDIIVTRKIGHPFQPEYAICAVAEDGHLLCNEAERAAVDKEWFEKAVAVERQEAKRRRETYQAGYLTPSVKDKTAIVVDDGIATGLTIRLAITEVKHLMPKRIIVAVPMAPREVAKEIKKLGVELVILDLPLEYAGAVGAYYDTFPQVEDEEVIKLLNSATLSSP